MNRRLRLSGRARFARVRAAGAEARCAGIRVRVLRSGGDASRAGFAVLAAPNAVVRNRLRRRLREATAPLLRAHPGFDTVVAASATGPEAPFAGLCEAVATAFHGARVRLERP